MLNAKSELEGYQSIHLESVEEKSGKLPENVREAIHLFNKALEDAQSRNEDIAIIALKKAIYLHPLFYEAMNLLGICYIMDGKEEMARAAFQQVIDTDNSSMRAMDYLKEIDASGEGKEGNAGSSRKRSNKTAKAPKRDGLFSAWLAKGLQREDNSLYGLKYILGILIGALFVGFIWYMVPTEKSLFTFEKVENITKDPELEEEIGQLNERIEKMDLELLTRKEENLKLMDSFQVYKGWVSRMEQAENNYQSGNFTQSADLLTNFQGMAIPDDLKANYQELWDKVRLKAAEQLYQEGNAIYAGNRAKDAAIYKQALTQYESAMLYLEDNKTTYQPILYYNAGKAAARADEIERAIELFESITRDFPNSQYSNYARTRIRELEEGKSITGS